MKPRSKILVVALSGLFLATFGVAQQSPIMTVSFTEIVATSGKVNSISLLSGGSGYATAPAVIIEPPPFGPGAVPASAVATIDAFGSINAITVVNAGAGYISPPAVSIPPPATQGGAAAVALANLGGTSFVPPNESSGPTNSPILIKALAVGTFPASKFVYTFRINGHLLGVPAEPPPNGFPAIVAWMPPEPGVYFISVTATDGANTAEALPVRFFATGTKFTSPLANTLVPTGSSVVVQATATAAPAAPNAFVKEIEFYADGALIGTDRTFPYSVIYTPQGPGNHTLEARGYDNLGALIQPTATLSLTSVTAIAPSPSVRINKPANATPIPIPAPGEKIPVEISASSESGVITKVELYIDGLLFGSKTTVPYNFEWEPTVAGTYAFVALAYDDKNNVVASTTSTGPTPSPAPTTVIIATPGAAGSNERPVVAITSPSNGTIRVGSSTTLRASASDPDGLIESVQFFVNGAAIGPAITAYPYQMQWTPAAEGIYRITAVALDNNGGTATSPTVLVLSSATGGDTVAAGTFGGLGLLAGGMETGNFAVVAGEGGLTTFIGYSTTPGDNQIYFFPNMPLSTTGSFAFSDSSGRSLVGGRVDEAGGTGTLDAGRLTFIGMDTSMFAGDGSIPATYYSGSLTGRPNSTLAAILGADGSLILYSADGSVADAAGGGLTGKIDGSGAFNFATLQGNTISGRIDPATRALTGTLSGPNGGAFNVGPSTLASSDGSIVSGAGVQVLDNVVDSRTGHTYDQVKMTGAAATITAEPGTITRISFVDLSNDIVQVEFSGAGTLSITLENASAPGPAINYEQPGVDYVQGHAGIVITGADETTNVNIFSVGRLTAANQGLFKSGVDYDGTADIAYLVILSTDGRFGGVFTGNVSYFATQGLTGICAPGVQFTNRVAVGDISASGSATPVLLLGSAPELLITGGSLLQPNGQPVQIGGFSQMRFVDGTTSHGGLLPAQPNQARLEQNGVDVAAQVVASPGP